MKYAKSALLFLLGCLLTPASVDGILFACPHALCIGGIVACLYEIAAYLSIALVPLAVQLTYAYYLTALAALGITTTLYVRLLPIYLTVADAALDFAVDELEARIELYTKVWDEIAAPDKANWTNFENDDSTEGFGEVFGVPETGSDGRRLADGDEYVAIMFNFTGLPANCDDCYIAVMESGACIAEWIEDARGVWTEMNVTEDGESLGIMEFGEDIDDELSPIDLTGATIVVGRDGTAFSCGMLTTENSNNSTTPAPGPSPTAAPTAGSGAHSLWLSGFFATGAAAVGSTAFWMIA